MNARKLIEDLVPQFLKNRINPENYTIKKFITWCSGEVRPTDLVLDAGAGDCQYKSFFAHARYESTDFDDGFDESYKGRHTFTCNLNNIPKENNTYDAIINNQVLEHVPDPQKVLHELYRVLKPNGKLFITVPQCWGIHGREPYNYFFFTKFGLELILKTAGFNIIFLRARGGIFWLLGAMSVGLPAYIFNQYIRDERGCLKLSIAWPFYIAAIPLFTLFIPLVCYHLDFLDKSKKFTLGYEIYCMKRSAV